VRRFACGKFGRKLARGKWEFSAPRGIAKTLMIFAGKAIIRLSELP
jgi:hypothetical protein